MNPLESFINKQMSLQLSKNNSPDYPTEDDSNYIETDPSYINGEPSYIDDDEAAYISGEPSYI